MEEGGESPDGEAKLRKDLLAKLEATVRDNPDLDAEGREYLMEHYRNAVATAPIEPSLIVKPDRKQWIEMLESLQADGLASEEDVAVLVRQFDAAMSPLDSTELELAVEFARRCEQDGEEQALAWMESRRAAAAESRRATAATDVDTRLQPAKPGARRMRSPRGPPAA